MHELSVASRLVQQVEQIVESEQAKKVVRIRLSLGALSGVERDPLEFSFTLVAKGTVVENAKLEIEEVPADLRCNDCKNVSPFKWAMFNCELCGSQNTTIEGGRELLLKSVEVI
ncbi:MAG: hydrogenase maturation nickel metallochaperone HypA [Pseudomonadota bacterium]